MGEELEITHVSSHGVWLLANGQELFMSYDDFPWFKDVSVGKILNAEQPTPGHTYWPDFDVDLSQQIINHPQRFPLKGKSVSTRYRHRYFARYECLLVAI